MKICILLICTLCFTENTHAQSAEDSVRAVIAGLFDAMKNSDSAAIQSSFTDRALLQTVAATGEIKEQRVAAFSSQVSKLPKNAADEKIQIASIKVDGPLASVWTPYQFYFQGTFSHCGANSFQLVRVNGIWKIHHLMDTRRKTVCH